jgi:hypothetical protein
MVSLVDLWLPILASAAFVFVVSSVIHMVFHAWHCNDYGALPGEGAILDAVRAQNVPPGMYRFPFGASMKEMQSPAMLEKLNRGPVGTAILIPPGPMALGKSLVQWFLYCVVVGAIAAYVAAHSLRSGAEFYPVFRIVGSAAFLGYALTNVDHSIWKGVSWGVTTRFVIDGIVYALVTAATFGWLWPSP